jgi:lipopolysaccharide assembly outer membrane protein LptD (OstA)
LHYYTQVPDTLISNNNRLLIDSDSIVLLPNSSLKDTTEILKGGDEDGPLKDPIFHDAKDSLLYSIDGKKVYMYGDAVVKHQKMELKAAYIEYDMENNLVFAEGRPDSTGTIVGKPIFVEGNQTFRMDKMHYNFETKKAKITNVITEEADGFLHSRDTKLMPDKTINVSGGKFTTCDLDHPHFYIAITKAKVIPGSKLITGPAYLVIGDVPFPLPIPFGFFPNKKGRSSGLIIPEYGEENRRGFFLRNGGFYIGLNDYFDLRLTGDFFTKGSWATNVNTTYRKRYKYSGGLSFSLSQNVIGEKGFDDYFKDQSYSLTWRHSQDPKANPNSRFSANLNLGSPSHNRYNAQSISNFHETSISSSVTYSKVWAGTPFSMTTSMNHSQNNLDSTITVGFPKASFNMNMIYPFKRKNSVGSPAWYEKIGLSYSGSLDNTVKTRTDSILSKSTLDKMKNGVEHRIPISTSFSILKFITVSPNANYSEKWYTQTIEKRWDEESKKVITDEVSGFKRAWEYSTAISMTSKVYGMYSFKSTSKVQAIRHLMTPSISLSYRPDFSEESYGFYKSVQIDTTGKTKQYSIFEGARYGGPGSGKSGSINFSLGNNLEMKVLTPDDTVSNTKKIKILESFNFSGSYNMLVDSMNWSPVSFSARTNLFDKFSINFSSSFDPYAIDPKGNRYKEFQYRVNGKPFRLTSANAGLSFSLQGGKGGKENKSSQTNRPPIAGRNNMGLDGDPNSVPFGESLGNGFGQDYVDYDIPWDVSLNYTFSYSKRSYDKNIMQSISFSGSLSLSPKWKVGFSSGYDFKNRKLTTTSLNINRDLHCWEMGIRIIPIGMLKSYSFHINVKSGTLRDLKYNKNQSRYDY